MQKRQLGQSDLWLSPIGLGTVKIGRNQSLKYPQSFDLPSDKIVSNLLAEAAALGINLIDTAPAYGTSEVRLGQLLPQSRNDWVIMSKAGEEFNQGVSTYNFTQKHLKMSLERSLKNLRTDYIDIFLIHSNGDDETIINTFEVFDTLARFKQEGKIRAYGMSTKTVAGGILTLEHADCAMITYNLEHHDEQPVIDYAQTHAKGILVKKAFMSGHFTNIDSENKAQAATEFVLKEPGVTSLITGTTNLMHLGETVMAAKAMTTSI